MPNARLDALRAWRQDLLDSGRPEHQLPTQRDLARLSETATLNRAALGTLALDRPEAAVSFFAGIMGVLRGVPHQTGGSAASGPTRTAEATGTDAATTTVRRSRLRNVEGSPSPAKPGATTRPDKTANGPSEPPTAEQPTTRQRYDQAPTTNPSSAKPATTKPPTTKPPTSEPPVEAPDLPPFAPLDLDRVSDEPSLSQTPLRVSIDANGALRLSWDRLDSKGVVLYRVVTSDAYLPYSPESGDVLVTTEDVAAVDRRPFSGATRSITVWVNVGPNPAAARHSQPRLLASGSAVAPVTDVELRVSEGIVTAEWSVQPGVDRVEVLRVPAASVGRTGYVGRFRLPGLAPRATSLRDAEVTPGERYQYRFFAVVSGSGSDVLSEPVVRDVEIAAPVLPVTQLRARQYEEDGRTLVDLEWPAPSATGDVRIYVTTKPHGATEGMEMAVEALAQAGLPDGARQLQQPEVVDGVGRLDGVPWPANEPRLFLTAVSIRGGRACVGKSVALVQVGTISEVKLVQRVNWQLLTFDWPLGAAEVQVYLSAPGMAVPENVAPWRSIDRETYDAQGGLRISLVRMGELGRCDLHLRPVSYNAGQAVAGADTRVSYGGMLRLLYRLAEQPGQPSGRWNRTVSPSRWFLQLQSDQQRPPTGSLALVLVHNAGRLPLDDADGTPVLRLRVATPALEPVYVAEVQRSVPGFYRLFVEGDPSLPFDVALLDPPVHTLMS